MDTSTQIFINYRQLDSSWSADYLASKLTMAFGEGSIFLDHRGIDEGDIIGDKIKKSLYEAKVLLVLIGENWLKLQNSDSYERRIDNEYDWVRYEIKSCLDRDDCRLIPVLLDDGKLPKAEHLPEDIRKLAECKSFKISRTSKDTDINSLISLLSSSLSLPNSASPIQGTMKRFIYERLVEHGKINLSGILNPYETMYDPDNWEHRTADITICFPNIDYINNAPKDIQLPSVAICYHSNFNVNYSEVIESSLFQKLLKYSPSKLFKEDKIEILRSISPILNSGLVAGVTLPARLFSSKVSSRKQKYAYGTMTNALVKPLIRFHEDFEFEINKVKIISIGNTSFETKLANVLSSEIDKTVEISSSEEFTSIARLLAWSLGAAINSGETQWIDVLTNDQQQSMELPQIKTSRS